MIDDGDQASAWFKYDADILSRPVYLLYLQESEAAGASMLEAHGFYLCVLGAMRRHEGGLQRKLIRAVAESVKASRWEALLDGALANGLFHMDGETVISPFIQRVLAEMNQTSEKRRQAGRKGGRPKASEKQKKASAFNSFSTEKQTKADIDLDIDIDLDKSNIPPLPPTGGDVSLEPGVNEFRDSGKPGSGVAPAEGESQDSREPQSRGASAPGWDGTPDGALFPDAPPPAAKPAKKTRQVLNAAQSAEFEQVLSRWNAQGREVVHVRAPTDLQRRRFRDLRKVYSLDDILATIEKIKINPFHTDTKAADLHWFLLPEKFEMVAAYRPREPEAKNTGVKAPSWARGVFDESKYEKPYQPPDPSIYE